MESSVIAGLLYRVIGGIDSPSPFQISYWTQYIDTNGISKVIDDFTSTKLFINKCMKYELNFKTDDGSQAPSTYGWLLYNKCMDPLNPEQYRIENWANELARNGGA